MQFTTFDFGLKFNFTEQCAYEISVLDANPESSTFPGLESPGKKQLPSSSTSSDTTAVSTVAVPSSKVAGNSNSSSNVGHPNKSKVMHELFGIEKSASANSDLKEAKMTTR